MVKILLTGFAPFAGRDINASWVAASLLADHLESKNVSVIEIPVEWGMPEKVLVEALRNNQPEIVICMGEGKPGCFQLETLALNQRAQRLDNRNEYPPEEKVIQGAPASMASSAPLPEIREQLADRGIPVLLSVNAGGFLCEETLFVMEHNRQHHAAVKLAVFVHLPPFGTILLCRGKERICDEELLLEFSRHLYDVVSNCYDSQVY